MYNRSGRYGLLPYNRAVNANAAALRMGTARGRSTVSTLLLRGRMRIYLRPAHGVASAALTVRSQIPLGRCAAGGAAGAALVLTVQSPVNLRAADGVAGVARLLLRTSVTSDISLDGVGFAPGDVLILDTDAITVVKNGQNAIRYWRTGSEPFRLAPGGNVIVWSDDAAARNVAATVIWQDRWV